MPRGYRCVLVAFVGWLSLAAANPHAENKQADANSNQTEQTATTFRAYPDLRDEACYHAKDHEAADLCAQWRAAIAAEKAAEATETATTWSKAATVLSGLALGALIWTLLQTEGALAEARKGNRIAEETAKRELRAYITTEDHDVQGLWRGGPTSLRLKIYNRGQTPAYHVKIWSIVSGTLGEPDELKIKQRKKEDFRQSDMMLGPGQWALHSNECQAPLNGDAYVGIVAGELKLVFAGVISYRDVFGKRHFTTFKQFYKGAGNYNTTSADLTACGRGNVAD